MPKKTKGDFTGPHRKLRAIVSDLIEMEEDLVPGVREKREDELAELDPWERKKYQACRLITKIGKDISDLKEMRKNKEDIKTISLSAECRRNLEKCAKTLDELQAIWVPMWQEQQKKMEKQAKKGDLTSAQLKEKEAILNKFKNRAKIYENLQTQHLELTLKMAKNPPLDTKRIMENEKKRVEAANAAVEETIDSAAGPRKTGNKNQDRKQRRQERKNKRQQKNKSTDGGDGQIQLQIMSQDEEEARAKIQMQYDEQDKLLDQIEQGVGRLKGLAEDIQINVRKQAQYIAEVSSQMDSVADQLEGANKKLENITSIQDGAMMTWCPRLVCILFLVSLLGYAYYLIA